MSPTRIRTLVILAVLAAAMAWGASELVAGQTGRAIPVPWLAALTMWLLAVALGVWALLARPRLRRKEGARPMQPIVAARTAALAMAASRTGALVFGFYVGTLIGALPLRISEAGQETVTRAAVASAGALAIIVIALWLEHLCRLPEDDDEGPNGTGETGSSRALRPGPGAVARADKVQP
jgi:hypothetical protein